MAVCQRSEPIKKHLLMERMLSFLPVFMSPVRGNGCVDDRVNEIT